MEDLERDSLLVEGLRAEGLGAGEVRLAESLWGDKEFGLRVGVGWRATGEVDNESF